MLENWLKNQRFKHWYTTLTLTKNCMKVWSFRVILLPLSHQRKKLQCQLIDVSLHQWERVQLAFIPISNYFRVVTGNMVDIFTYFPAGCGYMLLPTVSCFPKHSWQTWYTRKKISKANLCSGSGKGVNCLFLVGLQAFQKPVFSRQLGVKMLSLSFCRPVCQCVCMCWSVLITFMLTH